MLTTTRLLMKSIFFTGLALSVSLSAQTKIACVGDSITFGSGIAAREKLNYPAQLGYLLGEDYEVRNFWCQRTHHAGQR